MEKTNIINIEQNPIHIVSYNNEDYISLTDMARSQLHDVVIIKWLSLKNTIEYLGEWELLYNPDFNYTEFGIIKNSSEGTFAHKEIANYQLQVLNNKEQLKSERITFNKQIGKKSL